MQLRFDFLREAEALAPELGALRERIHRHPELGNQEYDTALLVERTLQGWGLETFRPLDTAVVGVLRGARPGKAAALRADLDALPVTEGTGVSFASETPGVMHACGHDVHIAAALGAARLLSEHREALAGELRFFFQPDEEGYGGAQRMVDRGCMGPVQAVFGCHVSPALPLGQVGVHPGKFYAAADVFDVTVTGRSAHEREKGIDALGTAAELVTELLALPASVLPERAVVTVGALHAGKARNVLAGRAELSGILRTLGPETRERMCRAVQTTVEVVAAKNGASAALDLRPGYDGIVNTPEATALVRRAATALLGADRVTELTESTMTTEDFGCFIRAAGAGSFYHIGAGCAAPLHSCDFLPRPEAVTTAAAVHAAVLWEFLTT